MKKLLTLALAIGLVTPALAQELPPSAVAVANRFVAGLEGRIRTLYYGVTNEFLFELQDRDAAQIFSYGLPPEDRGMSDADVVVIFVENWREAENLWLNSGMPSLANSARLQIGTGALAQSSEISSSNSGRMMVFTFARGSSTPPISDRCYARMVIHDVYNAGVEGAWYDLEACAAAMN